MARYSAGEELSSIEADENQLFKFFANRIKGFHEQDNEIPSKRQKKMLRNIIFLTIFYIFIFSFHHFFIN